MNKLHVIKASAGSGKTHALIGFFLETIIGKNPKYFKGILAVTFTNKATEEMKRRIIEELDILRAGSPSHFLDRLMKSSGWAEERIRREAGIILTTILHDYSWFNIETIDTFFQRIIRGFTREIGMPGNYAIEMEVLPALEFAVDALIDSIEDKSALLQWLIRFSEDKILEGKSWNIRDDLIRLGKEIFKEGFTLNAQQIFDAIHEKENLEKFRGGLHARIGMVENKLQEKSKATLDIIAKNHLDQNDFYQKGRGIVPYLNKLIRHQVDLPNNYVRKLLDGPDFWPASDTDDKEKIIRLASASLLPKLIDITDFVNTNLPSYYTAKEILKNIFSLGILSDISFNVIKYRQAKNIFLLSDAPVFIHRIIDQNDSPFIYEKIGNRYKHFLIDEFQDTSGLQWENFKPLISNSLSNGDDCLLVGDVKQSIYRWRNSDWNILASQLEQQYPQEQLEIKSLGTNWRSMGFITHFNGSFFSALSKVTQRQLSILDASSDNRLHDSTSLLEYIYQDVIQEVPDNNVGKGEIKIRFFERSLSKENPEYLEEVFLDQIRQLLDSGYSPGEIAVLARDNKDGQHLAELLIRKSSEGFFKRNVGVISNESLFLSASNAVNLLNAAMQYLIDPGDEINRGKLVKTFHIHHEAMNNSKVALDLEWKMNCISRESLRKLLPLEFIDEQYKLIALPLYDLIEGLIRTFHLDSVQNEIPFLHAFLDLIHEFVQTNSSDIEKFLKYWEENGVTFSVPAGDTQNALRILTIHKAKGLEFKAVVIPYCNWSLDQKPNNIFWARPTSDEFTLLPVFPINYKSSLTNSLFAEAYFNELFRSYIDNLNLLYVAFTRAIEILFVNSQISDRDKKDTHTGDVGDLIYHSILKLVEEDSRFHFDREHNEFHFGHSAETKQSEKQITKNELVIKSYEGDTVLDRLFIHPEGFDFFSEQQRLSDKLSMKGRVLHAVLSKVGCSEEIQKVFEEAFYDGLINKEEQLLMQKHIDLGLQNQQVASWFDGSGNVLNESEILLPSGETKRPDRVIIYDDRTVVVDYKFGSRVQEDKHRKQVLKYKEIVSEMGYSSIEGYLWYINDNSIVEV